MRNGAAVNNSIVFKAIQKEFGSIIIYSFLQSMGVINGHSKDCMCYQMNGE